MDKNYETGKSLAIAQDEMPDRLIGVYDGEEVSVGINKKTTEDGVIIYELSQKDIQETANLVKNKRIGGI